MITFFGQPSDTIFAVETTTALSTEDSQKLTWLFGEQTPLDARKLEGCT